MVNRLEARVAVVTGASSGLGRAIALAYAEEGASVVCADLQPNARTDIKGTEESLVPTHELIKDQGGQAYFLKTDVREEAQVEALISSAVEEYGRLDIMVNNAGIAIDVDEIAAKPGGSRIHETATATFDLTMNINVRGVFLGCKYATAQFLKQDPLLINSRGDSTRGWIINMASAGGLVALRGASSYITSKHAVVGMTKQIAIDYAKDRIHCNALCPSFVDTALISAITRDAENPIAVGTKQALIAGHPWGTLGQPEDVAKAAVFLASGDAQWITGIPLVIDGGYTAQ